MMREGWRVEGGVYVHLASEAAVDEVPSVIDLEDEIIADGFETLESAQRYVERRYEVDGHVSQWRD